MESYDVCCAPCVTHGGRQFEADISKFIFLYGNGFILIQISLQFVPNDAKYNKPALVQIMAWRLFWTDEDLL